MIDVPNFVLFVSFVVNEILVNVPGFTWKSLMTIK